MLSTVCTGDILRYEMLHRTQEVVNYAVLLVGNRLPEKHFPHYEVLVMESNYWAVGYGEWSLDFSVLKDCVRLA